MKYKPIFISFGGENTHEYNKPYCLQEDKNLLRQYTIDLDTRRNRKSLKTTVASFFRINFPYSDKKEHNISDDKNNKQIAGEIIGLGLRDAGENTRIYIRAHGYTDLTFLGQTTYTVNDNGKLQKCKCKITPEDLVKLFDENLPNMAKDNLQIVLLSCRPLYFASLLAEKLHNTSNFKNLSVVAYNEVVGVLVSDQKPNKNSFKLIEYSANSKGYNHEKKHHNEDKLVYHNYDGEVKCHLFHDFKERYQSNSKKASYSPKLFYANSEKDGKDTGLIIT
ncbi:hypothetical protein L3V86_08225 [Thiotrichales bacterium 19S11-10]|nr:hypothetical protein [Thiotrichales bacterium 19S11-10]